MADIIKSSDSTTYQRKVIYDAHSNRADVWMRDTPGVIRREIPLEHVAALRQFEEASKAAGLTITAGW